YSFGGTPHFPGQRFAGRLSDDPLGTLSLRETVLAEGEASQTYTNRWQDYAQTAIDPSDDTTIWYVGDYIKKGATNYSTRIGSFRLTATGAKAAPIGQPAKGKVGLIINDPKAFQGYTMFSPGRQKNT